MDLNDFLNEKVEPPKFIIDPEPKYIKTSLKRETTNNLIKVDEGSLIIAQQIQKQLINFQIEKKKIDKQEKELKNKLENIMRENNITKYESNDKTLMITLGEDSTTETVDKDKLFLKYPNVYRDEEIVKESKRKGSLRITIRESEENEKKNI